MLHRKCLDLTCGKQRGKWKLKLHLLLSQCYFRNLSLCLPFHTIPKILYPESSRLTVFSIWETFSLGPSWLESHLAPQQGPYDTEAHFSRDCQRFLIRVRLSINNFSCFFPHQGLFHLIDLVLYLLSIVWPSVAVDRFHSFAVDYNFRKLDFPNPVI